MNKTLSLLLLTLNLSLLVVPVRADEVALDDFAAGYELVADDRGAIYRLPLPMAVYQWVFREDLGDIRVFNRLGQAVPHAVRRQETKTTAQTARLALPFFPLEGETSKSGTDDLDVRIAEDGRIINIHYKGGNGRSDAKGARQYIVDLSAVPRHIDALEFDLRGDDDGYLKEVTLEGSDDLTHWRTLVRNAALSELLYAGHVLKKNSINLANTRYKYLRLNFDDNPDNLRIDGVRAMFNSVTGDRRRTWTTVNGERSEIDKQLIEFDTGGRFLVEEINLLLPEYNTLVEATLRSRSHLKSDWHPRHAGLFYRLDMQGTQLQQGPVSIRPTTDRYWQLEVKATDSLGMELPQLRFAWVAEELYFLARGPGPYTLAFGNANVLAPGKPIDRLMHILSENQESELIRQVALGNPVVLKGDAALQPEREIPWQRILLWSVLGLGVLIIAVMALRLFRQIS